MPTKVAQRTAELPGDPDEGLAVKKSLQARLLRQRKAVAAGARGVALDEVPWEDFYDSLLARQREKEPRETLDSVRQRLVKPTRSN
ncbi:MAG: hypothetical protein HYR56_08970 [Acidobacteria bacterium]|nr:hypothetical protein [Acidobacteriota bacterium]MBI3424778.1 hypothetical protein [Acidobacteriota bacterium]